MPTDTHTPDDDAPENVEWKPLVPFLEKDPMYCFGVEFGMWYKDCLAKGQHSQYVRTENESQMTLTCARLGWDVVELKAWDEGPPDNGWVWLVVENRNVEELAHD